MAASEATRGSGSEAPFVVIDKRQKDGRQGDTDSGEAESLVGGFVVTDTRAQEDASDSISVEQPLPRTRRCSVCGEPGHTARNCTAQGSVDVGTRAARKPTKDAVGSLAPMVVGTLNFCAVSTFGEQCGLTQFESNLLVPSMQRTLERMPAAAATKAAIIIDPLVILTVMIMWGKRIAAIKTQEAKEKYQVRPTEAARAAGVSGFTYSVPDAQQETNGTHEPMPTSANGFTYGAASDIREGFSDAI